jgi:hypothetical protein
MMKLRTSAKTATQTAKKTVTNRVGALPAVVPVCLPTFLAALLMGTFTSCEVEQPPTRCQSAHGAYAVRLTMVEGSGPCADLKGEEVGVNTYWRLEGDVASVTKGPVALRTSEVGTLLETYKASAESGTVAAKGVFVTEEPSPDGFCDVAMSGPATLKLAAVPSMPDGDAGVTDPLPAVELTQEWSNVRFYVRAAQPGTLFTGQLKYSKTIDGQACTATYNAVGIYPAVTCEGSMPAPNGGDPVPSGQPDESACDPCSNPAEGRPLGSGISPGIDVFCDPEVLACVPRNPLPSLLSEPKACGGT